MKTILLVEDQLVLAMTTEMVLNRNGYKVVKAISGEEAIEIINQPNDVDLILMDINLALD